MLRRMPFWIGSWTSAGIGIGRVGRRSICCTTLAWAMSATPGSALSGVSGARIACTTAA